MILNVLNDQIGRKEGIVYSQGAQSRMSDPKISITVNEIKE